MATSARWRSLFDVRNRASRVFEVERIVASIAETDDVVFWGILSSPVSIFTGIFNQFSRGVV